MNSPKSIFIMLSKGSLLFVIISIFLPFFDGYTITEISEGMNLSLIFSVVSIFITVAPFLRKKHINFRSKSLLLDSTFFIVTSIPIILAFIFSIIYDMDFEIGAIFAITGLVSSLVFLSIAASFKDTLTEEEKMIKQKKKYTAISLLLYLAPVTGLIAISTTPYSTPVQQKLIISGIVSIFLLGVSIKRKFKFKEILLISLPLIIAIVFLFVFEEFNYYKEYYYYGAYGGSNYIKHIFVNFVKVLLLQILICSGPAVISSLFTKKQK